jgi:hypothetical protein
MLRCVILYHVMLYHVMCHSQVPKVLKGNCKGAKRVLTFDVMLCLVMLPRCHYAQGGVWRSPPTAPAQPVVVVQGVIMVTVVLAVKVLVT